MSELQRQIQLAKYYRNLKFLVVDDFENFRLSVRQMIRAFGVEHIEIAGNGEDAVARCEHEHFDIILCDYNLGAGKNGQQVLEELRHNKLLKQTGIFVMVTAETSKDMVMGALEYLPDGYITKPMTKAALQKRLDIMIEQREALKPINVAIDKGLIDKAIELINEEIKAESKYAIWCYRKLAGLYYQKEKYDLARQIYESILTKRDIGWAQLGLGKVKIALGDYEGAIDGLTALLKDNENLIEAYDWLAEAQLKKGSSLDAQKTLIKAVEISPFAIIRQKKLAEVCTRNKDVEGASDAFRKTVKLGHNSVHESSENYLSLGRCLSELSEGDKSELGKKRAKEAVHTLERAGKKFKDNASVQVSSMLIQTRVHHGQGDEEKAKTILEKTKNMQGIEESDALIKLEYAKTLYTMGEVGQAEQLLSNLAQESGSDTSLMASIEDLLDEPVSLEKKVTARKLNKQGIGAFEKGELGKAIEVFEMALMSTPKHPALNLNMVQVMLKQIAEQGGNSDLKLRCEHCLANVQHIPEQHRQYKRYVHLVKKVQALTV